MYGQITVCLLLVTVISAFENEVKHDCDKNAKICVIRPWVIDRKQSMVYYNDTESHPVVWRNSSLKIRPKKCISGANELLKDITDKELESVITIDGTSRYILTVNGQYPGPSIVVYEGQEVVVNVTNNLLQEGTGLHWHGLVQLSTNYMDGVTGVTQCTISIGQTFTYRFKVRKPGTYWYHSHTGMQRSDGVYGAIIGLPLSPSKDPIFSKDFLLMTTDFYPIESNFIHTSITGNLFSYLYDHYNGSQCMATPGKMANGISAAFLQFHSALINGKGYHFNADGEPTVKVPLEIYNVKSNRYYKFRVFNVGAMYALKISVDQHKLVVVATESGPIVPHITDSIIVHIAERYEFYIYTNQPTGNYWIRAQTLEATENHTTLAILRYDGATPEDPKTTDKHCAVNDMCHVTNCPFRNYPSSYNTICTNLNSLRGNEQLWTYSNNFEEHFLQFGFAYSKTRKAHDASINGIHFVLPQAPPVVWGHDTYDGKCTHNQDLCTHQINVKKGNLAQFVLVSAVEVHPIHLHGFDYQVVHIGYPPENSPNQYPPEIICKDVTCMWNPSYDFKPTNQMPVLKDTVMVPDHGYVVIRIKADNPGWWFMHCHIEEHIIDGMAVIVKVGDDDDMYPVPQNISKCGSFLDTNTSQISDDNNPDGSSVWYGYIGIGTAVGFILGVCVPILFIKLCCYN